jgi:hypothetical protein
MEDSKRIESLSMYSRTSREPAKFGIETGLTTCPDIPFLHPSLVINPPDDVRVNIA